ncbi:cation:proton antiporter [Clostridium omnivorum]|uniref:Potassium transporter n=1 Tax=Clostridium omnivorum TaxID=1604902 RepID=A0ABQ5N2K8_9CLOT|nr:cation:proton antiporter [Clostridium sp. E14]GLC29290.1 potassium transporter [Clostridium sp. E14]
MHQIYLDLAIILISTKIGGMLSNKFKMPSVLGALIAGVLIGPSVLNIVQDSEGLKLLSNLGVVMLMFLAGMETDLNELKKAGLSSFLIAMGGVIVPFIFGTLCAYGFFSDFYENIFIGVILTATSVSISVETLNELGKLKTRAGMNILGAAVIDDIIGLIIVSFVLSLAQTAKTGGSGGIGTVMLMVSVKVIIFCIVSVIVIVFLPRLLNILAEKERNFSMLTIIAISLGLTFAFIAEELGIAAITGAYVCGLVISAVNKKETIVHKVKNISSYFLTPVFFASIGLATNIKSINTSMLLLSILLLLTAVLGKVFGCGIVAKLYGMSNGEAIQIGAGMVSRGEVALITTNLGLQAGIITENLYIPTLIVVVVTTLITPILLKMAFSYKVKQTT